MASKQKKERTYFELGDDWEVKNVRDLEFGTYFTLELPGLTLYDLRIVPEGKKWDAFIGMPEKKGKDGNWYKLFYMSLSDEDTKAIISEVEKIANKARK